MKILRLASALRFRWIYLPLIWISRIDQSSWHFFFG
jgi:hypothetical protein